MKLKDATSSGREFKRPDGEWGRVNGNWIIRVSDSTLLPISIEDLDAEDYVLKKDTGSLAESRINSLEADVLKASGSEEISALFKSIKEEIF